MNKVDHRRIQSLNDHTAGAGPVLYVMGRDQRVEDNWALIHAFQVAQKREVPLLVLFVVGPMFQNGTKRHNDWMVASLQEVEKELHTKHIPFCVECGSWSETVAGFAATYNVGHVVFDFNPLEPVRSWREAAAKTLAVKAEMVDARNIVPCWVVSQKTEFAAHTFRPKMHRLLKEFLTEFPVLEDKLPEYDGILSQPDWEKVAGFRTFDSTVPLPKGWVPGEKAALEQLELFLDEAINDYDAKRNDPNQSVLSGLSPYLRWGNISAARVALAIQSKRGTERQNKESFIEELIVRRELTDNYVYYTKGYGTLAGAHAWAQKTLTEHRDDKREYVYSLEQFETGATHDELWNAMQQQMVQEGKMHGWCRMYWAKKILEWTKSPEEAIEIALTLNDRYELDGRDSNGVVGVMWAIAGVHDRAWGERPVFGKIRYMNFNGAKRKFDVQAYIDRYSDKQTLFDD